jgi:hypothetical protein
MPAVACPTVYLCAKYSNNLHSVDSVMHDKVVERGYHKPTTANAQSVRGECYTCAMHSVFAIAVLPQSRYSHQLQPR